MGDESAYELRPSSRKVDPRISVIGLVDILLQHTFHVSRDSPTSSRHRSKWLLRLLQDLDFEGMFDSNPVGLERYGGLAAEAQPFE